MARGERGSATRRAYDRIRHDIIGGRLETGAMLSESDLAAELGVSRTPVRAALGRLQDEGWVVIYPQRGALVRGLSPEEVREAAEVRHAMETAGVRRCDPEQASTVFEALTADVDAQRAALAEGDYAGFNERSRAFHRAFVELAENATLLALYDRVADRQSLSIAQSARGIVEDPDTVIAEHRDLLARARERDWIGFAGALDAHQSSHHGVANRGRRPGSSG